MSSDYKFNSKLENFEDSPLWNYHIMVPTSIAIDIKKEKIRRVIACLNEDLTFHCALMSDGKGGSFIMLNKEIRSKLGLEHGSNVQVELKKDSSKYGMDMPEEFSSALSFDEDVSLLFHQLTPGKQRSLIHLVAKNKLSETRIKKALVIMDYLKNSSGKLDFKELNEAFKHSNRV